MSEPVEITANIEKPKRTKMKNKAELYKLSQPHHFRFDEMDQEYDESELRKPKKRGRGKTKAADSRD